MTHYSNDNTNTTSTVQEKKFTDECIVTLMKLRYSPADCSAVDRRKSSLKEKKRVLKQPMRAVRAAPFEQLQPNLVKTQRDAMSSAAAT